MAVDFPPVYPHSRGEAARLGELQRHTDSFRLNMECARAIEQAIRDHFIRAAVWTLEEGCAQPVLERFGFKRVNFVLANSLREFEKLDGHLHLGGEEAYRWGREFHVPDDGELNHYYVVNTTGALLEAFVGQTRDAFQALGLFGPEHGDPLEQDYTGKVLVLKPDAMKESCWDPRNQLWLGESGSGCRPGAGGQAVFAASLSDGETARWERSDFAGVLDERHLPDWAREKLEELRGPSQTRQTGFEMKM